MQDDLEAMLDEWEKDDPQIRSRVDAALQRRNNIELSGRIEEALLDIREVFTYANTRPGVPTIVRLSLADARDALAEALAALTTSEER